MKLKKRSITIWNLSSVNNFCFHCLLKPFFFIGVAMFVSVRYHAEKTLIALVLTKNTFCKLGQICVHHVN